MKSFFILYQKYDTKIATKLKYWHLDLIPILDFKDMSRQAYLA